MTSPSRIRRLRIKLAGEKKRGALGMKQLIGVDFLIKTYQSPHSHRRQREVSFLMTLIEDVTSKSGEEDRLIQVK